MAWTPKQVRSEWRYNSLGAMDEIFIMEDQVYGPLLNDLLTLLYNL
jgi:hypothetical protein